jgi:hypothetical protein
MRRNEKFEARIHPRRPTLTYRPNVVHSFWRAGMLLKKELPVTRQESRNLPARR